MRDIPFKNYIKVFLLSIVTVTIVFILANNYQQKVLYEREHPLQMLSNIKIDELESYLLETNDVYIYMASSSDLELEPFEKQLKEYITNNELDKEFIYLDIDNYSHNQFNQLKEILFSEELKKRDIILDNCPNILVIQEGKAQDILYSNCISIDMETVKEFMNGYNSNYD